MVAKFSKYLMRKRLKEAFCFGLALVAHLAFFVTISIANPYGAKGEGEGGVEVGLGLLVPQSLEPEVLELEVPQREFIQPVVELQPPIPELHPPEIVLDEVHFHVQRPIVEHDPIEIDRSLDHVTLSDPISYIPPTDGSFGSGSTRTYGGEVGARSNYVALISARLNKFKRYPPGARQDKQEGEVILSIVIERSGEVSSVEIRSSSGYELLDEAALSMVHRARPFPDFPDNLSELSLRFSIPLSFEIEDL